MITLSVKQPWAYLLCSGIKNIENRTWRIPEKYKGKRVLIHASGKSWSWYKTLAYIRSLNGGKKILAMLDENGYNGAWLRALPTSAIIGSVIFTDCVINHPSVWAEKNNYKWVGEKASLHELWYGEKLIRNWVAESPILFDKPITKIKGKLGFWDYPNILAETEDCGTELYCHCNLPLMPREQVREDLTGCYCKYCGGKWYR